jgi:hypothetical protein
MVLLEQGINKIRDYIYDQLNEGQLGTDGTAVTTADTALGNPIVATLKSLTVTKKDKSLKIDFQTSAGDGGGSNAREFGITDLDDLLLFRSVFPQEELGATSVVTVTTQLLILQDL